MGWDVKNGRRYYSRSKKVNGRVVRTYFGAGLIGQMAAADDALRRCNQRAAAQAQSVAQARLEAATKPVQELDQMCDLLARAALAAGGYHKHGGEWRKAMSTNTESTTTAAPAAEKQAGAAGDKPPVEDQLQHVLQRAQKGDRSALPELAKYLDDNPKLWRTCGDLAAQAQASWIELAAGDDLFFQQSIKRKADEMRTELAGPDAPPLEKLLADRVVATWLQVQYADAAYAQAKGMNMAQDAAAQKRQNAAQARHLAACKQLAVVRRLLKPAPSPLELLTFPVNEGNAGMRSGSRRAGVATQPVVN